MGIWLKRWMRSLSIMNLLGGNHKPQKGWDATLPLEVWLVLYSLKKETHLRKWGISYLCKRVSIYGLIRLFYTYIYIHNPTYTLSYTYTKNAQTSNFTSPLSIVQPSIPYGRVELKIWMRPRCRASLSSAHALAPAFPIFSPRNQKKTKVSMLHLQIFLALWSLEATVEKTKNLHQRSPPRHSLAYYRHQLLSSLATWNYGSFCLKTTIVVCHVCFLLFVFRFSDSGNVHHMSRSFHTCWNTQWWKFAVLVQT